MKGMCKWNIVAKKTKGSVGAGGARVVLERTVDNPMLDMFTAEKRGRIQGIFLKQKG